MICFLCEQLYGAPVCQYQEIVSHNSHTYTEPPLESVRNLDFLAIILLLFDLPIGTNPGLHFFHNHTEKEIKN
jgi:hypothetical protein